MKRLSLLLILLCAAPGVVAQTPAGSAPEFGGRLYRAVFTSAPDVLTEADLAGVPGPFRARLATFLARRGSLGSTRDAGAPGAEARLTIQRAIVSLVDVPDVEARAADFAARIPVADGWGERPDGPLAEASFAEDELKKAPGGALAPFLYVFIAQRQRAAFEAAGRAGDTEALKAAAKKYRLFVGRARSAADPIYGLIAADLDSIPYVHLESAVHPRDFNPDT